VTNTRTNPKVSTLKIVCVHKSIFPIKPDILAQHCCTLNALTVDDGFRWTLPCLSPTAVDYHVSSPKSHLYASCGNKCTPSAKGKSPGKARQRHPSQDVEMALRISHISTSRGRPPDLGAGIKSLSNSNWLGVKLHYRSLSRCCVSSLFAYAE